MNFFKNCALQRLVISRLIRLVDILLVCLLLLPVAVQAADLDDKLLEGQKMLAARNYAALRELLAPLLAEKAPPLEALFLAGMAAEMRGDYPMAIKYFRAMLTRDPALIRPRLELARSLQLDGQFDAAKYHYEQVLAGRLPDAVRRNINRELNDIRTRSPSFRFSFELASDTNPDQITSSKTVMIGGLPYTLTNYNQGKVKWGAAITMDMLYPFPQDPRWFAETYLLDYEYPGRSLDSMFGLATIGRRFKQGNDEYTLSVGGQVSTFQDQSQYRGGIVHATSLWVRLPSFAWRGDASVRTFDYSQLSPLNGKLGSLGLMATFIPNPTRRWELGFGINRYVAQDASYSYTQPIVNAHVSQEWTGGWITGLNIQGLHSSYDDPDPFFGLQRRDTEGRIEFEVLNRKIQWHGFSPQLHLGYDRRDSNLDLYAYRRFYSRIGISTSF
jgi:tetratricopeptide (TPR) repeat protein